MKLIKFPLSDSSGTVAAPDSIIRQLTGMGLNESGMAPMIDIDPLPMETEQALSEAIKTISQDSRVCILGGEHKLTYTAFRSFARKNPDAGLLILSARTGCKTDGFLRRLVNDGIVDKSKVILFGIRSWTGSEREFLNAYNIKHFTMKQIMLTGMVDAIDGLTETISAWSSVYLSIDMSIADPSCAPGIELNSPGGLTSRELIYLIQRLSLLKRLKMCDLVGLNPGSDMNSATSRLAAKLISELS
ncbi:MAG: arginase family protein [Candidatus Woesearchaeota archaeon]